MKDRKRIVISSHRGFCFGVKRALDIARSALKKRGTVYSFGPIIHNPHVVGEFEKAGLRVAKGFKKSKNKISLLIPSHGISPDLLGKKGVFYIDTTCPLVNRVRRIVRDLKKKGYFIVIVGDKKHPEVKGLSGMAGKNSRVIKNEKETKKLRLKAKKLALISQTTASVSNFRKVLAEMAKKDFTELAGFNTVCKNTIDRQKEARHIAGKVDAMFIIGAKESANTSRLAEVCREVNENTYHIESGRDLKKTFVKNKKNIGIATGASTPPYAIREVVERIRRYD